jgi:hypothetical protein
MGGLIQTKGTQRLARLFNNRFDAGGPLTAALTVKSSGNTPHPGAVLLPLPSQMQTLICWIYRTCS